MDKKKINIAVVIIIVLALIIAYRMYIKPLTIIPGSEKCAYTQVLDIDKVDVAYNEAGFTKALHVVASARAGGDCIQIAWTKEQLNEALKERGDSETAKYVATKDLPLMYLILEKAERRFGINDVSIIKDPKDTYAFRRDGYCYSIPAIVTGCDVATCKEKGYEDTVYATVLADNEECSWYQRKCACIETYRYAFPGEWSPTSRDYREVRFGITGIGEKTISGEGMLGSLGFGDKVLIKPRGDLFSGIWVSSPKKYMPVRVHGKWYFEDRNRFNILDQYYDVWLNGIKNCEDDNDCIDTTIENRLSDFPNSESERLYINQFLSENPNVRDAYISGNNLIYDLTTVPPTIPVFDIWLDAEWAGIRRFTTKPSCEFLQSGVSVRSGYAENIGINICNDEDNPGSISASIDCSSGISGSLTQTIYPFEGEGCTTSMVRIGGSAEKDVYGKCTVTVRDVNNPNIKESCGIDAQIKAVECEIPGMTKCSADNTKVIVCGNDGMWRDYEVCEHGCREVSSVKAECVEAPPQCPSSCQVDADCSPCGEDFVCIGNKCVKKAPEIECKSCVNWLINKIKGGGVCEPKPYLDVWWIRILPGEIEKQFTQDTLCPYVLGFYGLMLFLGFIIVVLIISIIIKKMKEK